MTAGTRSQSKAIVRIGAGVALSALSGVMLLLAFPPFGMWPLMWVGFVPMLLAQYRLMPRRWSSVAVAITDAVWLAPFLWRIFGPEAPWFLTYLGVIVAVFDIFTRSERRFHEVTRYSWFVPQGALYAAGFEMIRSFIPFLGTMGFVANSQASQPWLIQPVSVFGIYGLSLVLMLFNHAVALTVFVLFDRTWQWDDVTPVESRTNTRWLAVVGVALAVWIGISITILSSAPAAAPTVRVAALQPNFAIPAQFDAATQERRLQVLAEQTREAGSQGARVLFTPEMGLGFDPQAEHTEELKALAAETDTYLFLAYALSKGEEYHNESVLLTPEGEFLDIYGKNHPAGEPRTVSAGSYPVYETHLGRLATIICMDANFTDSSRILAGKGAQLIAVPTFDSTPGIAEQMWSHVVMRAVENRVAAVKTGHAYGAAIVDPYGRIVDMKITTSGERLTLIGDVPLGATDALYTRVGDWMGWLCLAGFIFFTVFVEVTNRRQRRAQKTAAVAD
jgi:apolipoprotein N-acyltransferase